jgi:hypothetical protein
MRILHVIPGVDRGAPENLVIEHENALESASFAAKSFRDSRHKLSVLRVTDPDWPAPNFSEVDSYCVPIETVSVGQNMGVRPRFRSFLPANLTERFDLVILTNSDISVTTDFYFRICEFVEKGFEAGSITRRTILGVDPRSKRAKDLAIASPNWYTHPGSDCFFFPQQSASVLRNSKLYMGVPPVGRSIVVTLSALNPTFTTFLSPGITFHYGNDTVWKTSPDLLRLADVNHLYWLSHLIYVLKVTGLPALMRGFRDMPWQGKFSLSSLCLRFLSSFFRLLFRVK